MKERTASHEAKTTLTRSDTKDEEGLAPQYAEERKSTRWRETHELIGVRAWQIARNSAHRIQERPIVQRNTT